MSYQKCNSNRVASISAKHSDSFTIYLNDTEYNGYAPHIKNVCNGDYTAFEICLNCGQVKGEFPIPQLDMEQETNEDDIRNFFRSYFNINYPIKMIVQSNGHHKLLNWAEERVSLKFRSWLNNFLQYTTICPSIDDFVKWFKTNKYSDEE